MPHPSCARRKVIMVRLAVRCLVVLSATIGVFVLTWRLVEYFFHDARDVSQTIASLVAGFIPLVLGRWATRKERAGAPAAGGGNLNASSSSRAFRLPGHLAFGPGSNVHVPAGIALVVTALLVVTGLVVALLPMIMVRAQPAVTSPAPPAGPPVFAEPTLRDGAVSEIASSETGLCVEVRNLEKDEGATVDQGTCLGGSHQKFKVLVGPDPGNFKLQAIHSDKCLTVINDRRVVQESCTENGQFWKVRFRDTKRGWHYWEIRSASYGGGLCLDLSGFNREKGAPLQAWECNNGNNQQWRTRA